MEHPFDHFTKTLAQPQSRREVLRGLWGLLGGLLLTSFGLRDASGAPINDCVGTCGAWFPGKKNKSKRAACKRKCARCEQRALDVCKKPGKRVVCCPAGSPCCGGNRCCPVDWGCCEEEGNFLACRNLQSDDDCGRCGNRCPNGEVCFKNSPQELPTCANPCTDSGPGWTTCRNQSGRLICCNPDQFCGVGVCEPRCAEGFTICRGAAGAVECCRSGEICRNGRCVELCDSTHSFTCRYDSGEFSKCCTFSFVCRNGECVYDCPENTTPCVSRKRPGEVLCLRNDPECICCPDADRIQDLAVCGDLRTQYVCCGGTVCGTPNAVCRNGRCELA